MNNMHVSRSWTFPESTWLRDCACRQTPCGGTYLNDWLQSTCPDHNALKTIRNTHYDEECPNAV